MRQGGNLVWTAHRSHPAARRSLGTLLRSQLNPLTSRISPLRYLTTIRVEQYYARTLDDVGLAQRWAAHYLSGLELPVGANVFDHGCGRGRHAALLRQRGYRVSAQDIAAHPWWDRLPDVQFQVVPPEASRLPWQAGSFAAVFDVGVLHYLDEEELERLVAEVHRVLEPGGVWVLVEANAEGYGAALPRRFMGRLHALSTVRRLARNAGLAELDQSYEGVYSPIVPRLVNFVRQQAWPGPLDVSDYGSTLERVVPPRRRAFWRLRLQKPKA
jgi:SAM-dependent methyltransferase